MMTIGNFKLRNFIKKHLSVGGSLLLFLIIYICDAELKVLLMKYKYGLKRRECHEFWKKSSIFTPAK